MQRVITAAEDSADFLDALVPKVRATGGDPLSGATGMGTLISEAEAQRVERSIKDAVGAGADC